MIPEFSRRNINSKTLGERLREIRERAGISIEEIATAIKVNKKYLMCIEADNYEDMPSDIYVRGFLKNYSNFLGIEAEDVLKIYKKERGIESNIKKKNEGKKQKKKIKIPTIVLSSRVIFGVLFGLFVLVISWYFYKEAGQFSETPRLLISKPINNSITKQSSTELVGLTDIGNKVTINGRIIFVNEKGEFREQVTLKNGINELVVSAVNKFNKKIEKIIKLSAQYDKQFPNKNVRDGENKEEVQEKSNKIKLTIKVKKIPVWVAIKVDGVGVYDGTILVGSEQVFEGNNEVVITSGRANQTLIRIDNEQNFHELATGNGVVRDIVFKKQEKNDTKINKKAEKISVIDRLKKEEINKE
jgi:transcriptional regulator with XRE-family HTH domain